MRPMTYLAKNFGASDQVTIYTAFKIQMKAPNDAPRLIDWLIEIHYKRSLNPSEGIRDSICSSRSNMCSDTLYTSICQVASLQRTGFENDKNHNPKQSICAELAIKSSSQGIHNQILSAPRTSTRKHCRFNRKTPAKR